MTTDRRLIATGMLLGGMLLIALVGCGGSSRPTYRAGGKVVFLDGAPLTDAMVEFRSVGSEQPVVARGQVQSDGSFQLSTYRPNDGAVEGEHSALVTPLARMGHIEETKGTPMVVDSRFTQFGTSGWKFTVTPDTVKNQFVLQVDRPRNTRP
jgi:hypothetical protein